MVMQKMYAREIFPNEVDGESKKPICSYVCKDPDNPTEVKECGEEADYKMSTSYNGAKGVFICNRHAHFMKLNYYLVHGMDDKAWIKDSKGLRHVRHMH